MEFGKLDDINGLNWNLPEDDPKNISRFKAAENPILYFGSPAWAVKHWVGKLYPKSAPPSDYLRYYSKNFNSIELNTTHYRIPDFITSQDWLSKVPSHFHFSPKVIKDISHERNGLVDKIMMKRWTDFLENMRPNLGPCFIQLHENFSYLDKALLFKFLENWPEEFKLSIELRHPSWFEKNKIIPALTDYLFKKGIGLVITDVAGRRDVLHTSISAPWTIVRLIGNSLHQSDEQRLSYWAEKIRSWNKEGLNSSYMFLHQPDDILTIEFVRLAARFFTEKGFEEFAAEKLFTAPEEQLSIGF